MRRLAVLFLMLSVATGMSVALFVVTVYAEDKAEYVGNSKCKMCHNKKTEGEVWNKWKAMSHAKAFETLRGDKAIAIGKERGLEKPPHESPECLECHVTGYDVKEKAAPTTIKPEDSIQCESCHGPASLHVAAAKKATMSKDASIDPKTAIVKPDEKVCLKCHNDKNPTWNPEKYTLKDEDGKETGKAGFDFKQAWEKIKHGKPKEGEGS